MAKLFSFSGLPWVSWKRIDARLAAEFPAVPLIEGEELALLYRTEAWPVVIDVRKAEEFAVSHLPDALNLQGAEAVAERVTGKTAPIVVYCAVGFRSADLAQQLMALGYCNVRNLRHAIFAWADAGRPLFNVVGPTTKVHPYDRSWGRLVSRDLHAFKPGC